MMIAWVTLAIIDWSVSTARASGHRRSDDASGGLPQSALKLLQDGKAAVRLHF